ncbi:MAG: hypothetical protein ACT4QC_11800 [Planctomycetaceae bacterium]
MPTRLSVLELERLLGRQRQRLRKLMVRRERLKKELARIEIEIASVGGPFRESRSSRRRPKNKTTLLQAVIGVLGQHKKGLPLRELADKVRSGGYKTISANFENTIYQVIYNNSDKVAHDSRTKTYRLK